MFFGLRCLPARKSGAWTFGSGCASPTTGRLASSRGGSSDCLLNSSEFLSEQKPGTFVVLAFALSAAAVSRLK